jgi:hypothetical protein
MVMLPFASEPTVIPLPATNLSVLLLVLSSNNFKYGFPTAAFAFVSLLSPMYREVTK